MQHIDWPGHSALHSRMCKKVYSPLDIGIGLSLKVWMRGHLKMVLQDTLQENLIRQLDGGMNRRDLFRKWQDN